jgi:alkylhydroperoxidase family enzyme
MITNERIAPLDPARFTPEQAALVGDWTHLNFSRVLIRHPGMYGAFVPYLARLIADTELPARDRQLVCLRMLELCDDTYEQTHHVVISRKCGLDDADIEAAISGEGRSDWDRIVLRATEEIYRDQNITDETWEALAQQYSEWQLMELVFLAGCYQTMAMLTKTFGMQLEGDLESFNALRSYAE